MACFICKSEEKDEVNYGEWKTMDDVQVHYFCLLLSTNLLQKGKDEDGILGFLLQDICEFERSLKEKNCCYCEKSYANISCHHINCNKSFHTICGYKNKTLSHFADTFRSFCHEHVPKYRYSQNVSNYCNICTEWIEGEYNPVTWIPSCKHCVIRTYYHLECFRKFALLSGYDFKCPTCGIKGQRRVKYRKSVRLRNVYVPECESAWANEPSPSDKSPEECAAGRCYCLYGRAYKEPETDDYEWLDELKNPWKLITCEKCQKKYHRACDPYMDRECSFWCEDCMPFESITFDEPQLRDYKEPKDSKRKRKAKLISDEEKPSQKKVPIRLEFSPESKKRYMRDHTTILVDECDVDRLKEKGTWSEPLHTSYRKDRLDLYFK